MATGGPTNNSLAAAVMYLNQNMWSASVLGRHNVNGGKITFHGEMTPRVYDRCRRFCLVRYTSTLPAVHCSACPCRLMLDRVPVIQSGYASCTDVSILYVDALRTIGVPARVTGTPAWCASKLFIRTSASQCEHIRAPACLLSTGTVALAVHRAHRKVIIIGSRYSLVRHTAGRRTSMAGRLSKRCQLAGVRVSQIRATNGFARTRKATATGPGYTRRCSPRAKRRTAPTTRWRGSRRIRVCLDSNARTSTLSGAINVEHLHATCERWISAGLHQCPICFDKRKYISRYASCKQRAQSSSA